MTKKTNRAAVVVAVGVVVFLLVMVAVLLLVMAGVYDSRWSPIIGALYLIFCVVMMIGNYGSESVELDDGGIIVKSRLVPWDEVFWVDVVGHDFRFYYYTDKGHKYYNIPYSESIDTMSWPVNRECLKYAVKKLQPDIFTEEARNILKEIDIWDDEFDVTL